MDFLRVASSRSLAFLHGSSALSTSIPVNKLEEHSFHDQALEVRQYHFLHSLKKRIRTGNHTVAIFGKSPIPIYQEINGEEDKSTILNHA